MRIPSSAVSLPIAERPADGNRAVGTAYILIWTVLLFGLTGPQAPAWQQNAPPEEADEDAPVLPQRLPTDRKTNQVLSQLRDSLQAGRAGDALDEFRTLQTADPLTLVPADEGKIYIPLFRAMFELAFQLPADVRDALVETEAARMQRRLAVAVQDGNLQAISEVVLAGAGTPASIDAHWIVARLHLARGNVTAAQTWLLPLTAPGLPKNVREQANRLLADFRPGQPGQPAETATETPPPVPPDDQRAVSAEPQADGPDRDQGVALPENLMWQSRPNISPRLRGQIDVFLQSAAGSNFPPQTSWREVIDKDHIYRRSLRGLTCVDTETGQSIWEYPLLPPVEPQISSSVSSSPIVQRMQGIPSVGFTSMDSSPFVSVFCRDNSIGQIASDSETLYLIQNTPDYLGASRSTPQFVPFGARSPKRDSGRMIAIEKSSGRRIWTLAETTLEERLGPSSSSGWFGGPPLADGHFLYSVFEWDGEMRLGCISRITGELRWSCVLAFPEQTIDRDAVRSLWGCTPVRREGLIWCPTSTGWLTCVDEATQSIVFASKLHELKQQEPMIRMGRNQPVVFTRSASLRDRWSVVRMVSSADRMVIAAHESRDLVWMEAATGVQLKRQEVVQGEILVHADSDRVILSTAEHVRAFDTYSGQFLWLLQLNDTTGYPFGQGTLMGDTLALPMSTGCIAAVDLQSGKLTQTSRNVLPSPGWGRLEAVGDGSGDFYYLAADRLWRLSSRPTTETSGDPLEIAQGLLDSGDWQGALDVARSTESTMAERAQLEAVIFAAQLQLAASNPEADLAAIRNMPLTAEQQLQLTVLDACLAQQRGDVQVAADALLKIVRMPMEFLKAPAPAVARNWPTANDSAADAPQESVLTWATCCMTEVLDNPQVDARLTDALQSCSNDIISRISHSRINDVLTERIRSTESLDQLFGLLRQSRQLNPDSAERRQAERELLAARLNAISTGGQYSSRMQQLMLRTVISELGEPFADLTRSVDSADAEDKRLTDALKSLFGKWNAAAFARIPVNRSASFGQLARVYPVRSDDPFLSRYGWSVVRSSSGRMQARSLEDPSDRWSIPGNVQAYGTYSGWSDQLFRIGSVILLRTSRSLTAVSVFDQRVLWGRNSFKSGITRVSSFRGNFTDFDGTRVPLPTHTNMPTYQLVGYGSGWICLHHGNSVEVLDLLNGATYWSMNLDTTLQRVIATDDFVIVKPQGKPAMAFDTLSGRPQAVNGAEEMILAGIIPTSDGLVMWRKPQNDAPRRLEWISPATGEVNRTVSLDGMQHFHFLDDASLVGLHDDSRFTITSLLTGEQQSCSWAAPEDEIVTLEPVPDFDLSPVKQAAKAEEGANAGPAQRAQPAGPADGPDSPPLWSTSRVHVVRDACHYFVTNHAGPRDASFRAPFGRNSSLVVGGLRMIDRDSGELVLALATEDRLVASTDQPELGLLVLTTETGTVSTANGLVPSQLTGWSRSSGKQLFRQVVPSRYGSRFLDFGSPEPNVLDIALQGFRLRLDGTQSANPADAANAAVGTSRASASDE